ncbi:protein kinase [Simkania negevensis]|uniref:Protein kinase n=1 Tax=Simkania negevensis TaxID=83561 RepID=A0ABS3AQV0_9BACT|nr:protein kinase [Simkania negevensis]
MTPPISPLFNTLIAANFTQPIKLKAAPAANGSTPLATAEDQARRPESTKRMIARFASIVTTISLPDLINPSEHTHISPSFQWRYTKMRYHQIKLPSEDKPYFTCLVADNETGYLAVLKYYDTHQSQAQEEAQCLRRCRGSQFVPHLYSSFVASQQVGEPPESRWEKYVGILLEYPREKSLSDYMPRIHNCSEEVQRKTCDHYLHELNNAITFLHTKNIIHGAITPDNVHVTHSGKINLSEFTYAQFTRNGQMCTGTLGSTTIYTAPEVIKDEGYTCSADLWSFGIIACRLLIGPRFEELVLETMKRENKKNLWEGVLAAKKNILELAPVRWREVLERLLEERPAIRSTIIGHSTLRQQPESSRFTLTPALLTQPKVLTEEWSSFGSTNNLIGRAAAAPSDLTSPPLVLSEEAVSQESSTVVSSDLTSSSL